MSPIWSHYACIKADRQSKLGNFSSLVDYVSGRPDRGLELDTREIRGKLAFMRKRLISPGPEGVRPHNEEGWIDVDGAAVVEVTSEEEDYPIESALLSRETRGWRAAGSTGRGAICSRSGRCWNNPDVSSSLHSEQWEKR
jgi:hypothetical protein